MPAADSIRADLEAALVAAARCRYGFPACGIAARPAQRSAFAFTTPTPTRCGRLRRGPGGGCPRGDVRRDAQGAPYRGPRDGLRRDALAADDAERPCPVHRQPPR